MNRARRGTDLFVDKADSQQFMELALQTFLKILGTT